MIALIRRLLGLTPRTDFVLVGRPFSKYGYTFHEAPEGTYIVGPDGWDDAFMPKPLADRKEDRSW